MLLRTKRNSDIGGDLLYLFGTGISLCKMLRRTYSVGLKEGRCPIDCHSLLSELCMVNRLEVELLGFSDSTLLGMAVCRAIHCNGSSCHGDIFFLQRFDGLRDVVENEEK